MAKLLKFLHMQCAVWVAPFIMVAAFTGVLYGLTPQLEQWVYQDYLKASHVNIAKPQPLSHQVEEAQKFLTPQQHIMAVRPAVDSESTTRVMYMSEGKTFAIFINPYTLKNQGVLPVYGTSGVLPIRTFLDQLHRSLFLGEWGRWYSELAASWLGIFAITGLLQYRKNSHAQWGMWFLPILFFFSVTGLTWSAWAGSNIAKIRHMFNGDTPTLQTHLNGHEQMPMHHHMDMMMTSNVDAVNFDRAVYMAKQAGLTSSALQIKPSDHQAWVVEEIKHRYPIQVDAIAIDMHQQRIIDATHFKDYPLSAKLTRWGVDFHIGVLFGIWNQIILVTGGIGILIITLLGYRIWWRKNKPFMCQPLSKTDIISLIGLFALLGFFIPVWVISVMLLVCISRFMLD